MELDPNSVPCGPRSTSSRSMSNSCRSGEFVPMVMGASFTYTATVEAVPNAGPMPRRMKVFGSFSPAGVTDSPGTDRASSSRFLTPLASRVRRVDCADGGGHGENGLLALARGDHDFLERARVGGCLGGLSGGGLRISCQDGEKRRGQGDSAGPIAHVRIHDSPPGGLLRPYFRIGRVGDRNRRIQSGG